MNDPPNSLSQLQTWMQSVIMHPGGVEAGVRDDAAQAQLAIEPERIETVIERSQNLTSIERLEIYSRAYYARLIECLHAEFPMLAKAVGGELFAGFAADYLRRYPSRSYTLGELGTRFAAYLRETRPEDSSPDNSMPKDDQDSWPDFLIDLAELEWHFSQVFDGPGAEDEKPIDAGALRAIPPEQWADSRLVCVPCLRMVALRYPVHRYWRALRDDAEAVPPDAADTWLAISRRDYVVRHLEQSRPAFVLLGALQEGATVGEAIGRAAEFMPSDPDACIANVRAWFGQWSSEGLFLAVSAANA